MMLMGLRVLPAPWFTGLPSPEPRQSVIPAFWVPFRQRHRNLDNFAEAAVSRCYGPQACRHPAAPALRIHHPQSAVRVHHWESHTTAQPSHSVPRPPSVPIAAMTDAVMFCHHRDDQVPPVFSEPDPGIPAFVGIVPALLIRPGSLPPCDGRPALHNPHLRRRTWPQSTATVTGRTPTRFGIYKCIPPEQVHQ